MNWMRDNAKMPPIRQSRNWLSAFLSGALTMAILFAMAAAFGYLLLISMVKEAEMRAARNVIIGISQSDRNCVEWRMEADNAWRCIRR